MILTFNGAMQRLHAEGLHTPAAMILGQTPGTRQQSIQVIYPKSFADIIPVPDEQKLDLALAISESILKDIKTHQTPLGIRLPQ